MIPDEPLRALGSVRVMPVAFTASAGYTAPIRVCRGSRFRCVCLAAALMAGWLMVLAGVIPVLVATSRTAEAVNVRIVRALHHDQRSC